MGRHCDSVTASGVLTPVAARDKEKRHGEREREREREREVGRGEEVN